MDLHLFTAALILLALGLIFAYSVSYPHAIRFVSTGDPAYYLKRQLLFAAIGLVALVALMYIPLKLWKSAPMMTWILIVTLALLLGVLFAGVNYGRQAKRWLCLWGFCFQPSEIAKITVVLYTARFLAAAGERIRHLIRGLLPLLLVVGMILLLIYKEPHLGATVVIAVTFLVLLFVGGARLRHLIGLMIMGAGGLFYSIFTSPYQMRRLMAWIDPLTYPLTAGYQIIHARTALARGGWSGVGWGRSIEKFFYLPECLSDSLLAVVGEEIGFLGLSFILLTFLFIAWRGLRLAERAKDDFSRYTAVGLSTTLFFQALLNYLVNTNLVPQTGVGLPFFSIGGSALVCFLASIGLLLNISRQVS